MQIYFLIPVFNESLNIETLYLNLENKYKERNRTFVFIDDCSTDNTVELIKSFFSNERIHLITKQNNAGPGDSFNIGFEWILDDSKSDKDLVVTMEADNTSDINLLSKMISISEIGYDLVLASVYAQGGGFSKTSWFRKFISFFANMFFRSIFNVKILTLSSFYRVYHVSLLKKIKTEFNYLIHEKGFICMLEILLKAIKVEANIIEVPMLLMSDKRKGKSKMKILKTTLSYIKFLIKQK